MSSYSFLLPAFNEAERIGKTLQVMTEALTSNQIKDYEIIVIDDGSEDQTKKVVQECMRKYKNIKMIENEKNIGKGYSLKKGVLIAEKDFVFFYDADLEITIETLMFFIQYIEEHDPTVIIGSKLHNDSKVGYSKIRKLLSLGYFMFIKILFRMRIKDTQTGIKAFKKEVIKEAMQNTLSERFTFDLEILYKILKNNHEIKELPVEIVHRQTSSSIKPQTILHMFGQTLKIYWQYAQQKDTVDRHSRQAQ